MLVEHTECLRIFRAAAKVNLRTDRFGATELENKERPPAGLDVALQK